jgi:hypothetical protein
MLELAPKRGDLIAFLDHARLVHGPEPFTGARPAAFPSAPAKCGWACLVLASGPAR